ncbi:hypothetical protein [Salisaeta longa]|uniref:hypothetical protein n=1 Tax=Salisaeta longa TaxID=503170 RepID=UPI00146C2DF7|nr:hypothetical protein [Salisaeta longa]
MMPWKTSLRPLVGATVSLYVRGICWVVGGILCLHALGLASGAQAQPAREGRVVLNDWPAPAAVPSDPAVQRLPEVAALALDYRYRVQPEASAAQWTFTWSWQPGDSLWVNGRPGPAARSVLQGFRMTQVEVKYDVLVEGQQVAEMIVAVDSFRLAPHPARYRFTVDVSASRVFLDTEGAAALSYLKAGVTLARPTVLRVGFVEAGRTAARRSGRSDRASRQQPVPTIFTPRIGIFIGWRVGPDPYYVDRDDAAGRAAPRTTMGRGAADEEPRASGDDDAGDDEDDVSLGPAATVAFAAVGLTALVGGTVGYYGTGEAPLGLMAGYVQPSGGFLLQTSINARVLTGEDRQHLTAQMLGFGNVFRSVVQPAVGLGVHVETQDDTYSTRAAVPVGLVVNASRVVVFGGVDLVGATPMVGLAVNLRSGR